MSPVVSILVLIASLVGCLISGIDVAYGLVVGMFAFMAAALKMGFGLKDVLKMMWNGVQESFIVVGILFLIGCMTGIWRGCATVQLMVVYGAELIDPKLFIFFAFLLCAAVSFLIGTSFGTAATIGVVMMTLCRVNGGNLLLTTGAVISGIYFGDRSAPTSSCAALVAHLTKTELYRNVRRMLTDILPALLLTSAVYFVLSLFYPLERVDIAILNEIRSSVRLTPWLLIPPLIVLLAPFVKLNIKAAIGLSIAAACVLALAVQKMSPLTVLKTLITGYEAEGTVGALLSGGGLFSMMHSNLLVVISATFSGIFNGTHMLAFADGLLERMSKKMTPYQITLLTGFPIIMFSCNQTLSLMLQAPLLKPLYEKQGLDNEQLMLDLSNTTALNAGIVPWCVAISNPLDILGGSSAAIPFAFLLYFPELVALIRDVRKKSALRGQ